MSRLLNKLLLLSMLPAMVIAFILTFYMTTTRIADLEQLMQDKAAAVAQQIAVDNVNTVFTRNKQLLVSKIDSYFSSYSDLIEVRIYSADKKFSHSLSLDRGTATGQIYAGSKIRLGVSAYSLEDYDFYEVDPDTQASDIGFVEVWMIDNSYHQKSKIILNSILIMLVMLGLTAMAVFPMSRKLLIPINRLAKAFKSLAQGAYHTRVDEDSKDELLTLQRGFNQMSKALETHNEELNAQVSRMTHDLQTTLEALEIQNVELDIARRQAIESSRVKSEFLANMSHEIRTPMNGIVGFTGLLHKTPLNEVQEQYLETIDHSAKSLLQILNDILDFSKIEAGKIEISRQNFVLEDCVSDVISMLTPLAHEKHLNLIPLLYNDLPRTIIGDRNRVIQLLSNLLSNAIKFTNEGDVVLRVMLENCENDSFNISFAVTDTGIGIPEAKQRLLFKPFTQISSHLSRGFGGTGLGLSISKSLVELMGGKIEFTSETGVGSTFTFTLPFIIGDNDFIPDENLGLAADLKILLLDSHRLSLAAINNNFIRLGLNVEARDTFSLNAVINEDLNDYSLLVISSSEEELDKLDNSAIQRIKELKIPCLILLSTSNQSILERNAQKFQCRILKKPISFSQIKSQLKQLLFEVDPSSGNGKPEDLHKDVLTNKKLLVVDDNVINQQLMEALLQNLGAEVTIVDNGNQAVELSAADHFDLIFMDIHMPDINGIEATAKIREQNQLVPIIALTADIAFRESDRASQYGFNDVLLKPIESEHLNQVINKVLQFNSMQPLQVKPQVYDDENIILPARDIEQALRITGGQRAVADKLLAKLIEQLPDYLKSVTDEYKKKDWSQLWQVLHKLHGATAVCGVPALNHVVTNLQKHITNADYLLISNEIEKLRMAAENLMEYSSGQDIR